MTSQEDKQIGMWDVFLVFATLGYLSFIFFPTVRNIALICWNDDDYSHGLLLPLVGFYMLWDSRELITKKIRDAANVPRQNNKRITAIALLVLGLLALYLGEASGITYASWIGFFPAVLGAVHLLFGRTAALCFAPPFLLLFMAKPLPDSFVVRIFWPLQVLAARASKQVLEILDVPVHMVGNIIEIPAMKLLVEEACSGMRSVMALLTLALIVIYFVKLRFISKLLLLLAAVSVAVALNITRVALTGVLAHFYDPQAATGFFHTFSGMIVFIIGLPILYYTGIGLMKLEQRFTPEVAA